ncbi:MAG: hypothetical protein IJM30_10085 [Thermoguttaceae bacterium]|nr:hypothetical protein [Thermoguttaceae bacterium]
MGLPPLCNQTYWDVFKEVQKYDAESAARLRDVKRAFEPKGDYTIHNALRVLRGRGLISWEYRYKQDGEHGVYYWRRDVPERDIELAFDWKMIKR